MKRSPRRSSRRDRLASSRDAAADDLRKPGIIGACGDLGWEPKVTLELDLVDRYRHSPGHRLLGLALLRRERATPGSRRSSRDHVRGEVGRRRAQRMRKLDASHSCSPHRPRCASTLNSATTSSSWRRPITARTAPGRAPHLRTSAMTTAVKMFFDACCATPPHAGAGGVGRSWHGHRLLGAAAWRRARRHAAGDAGHRQSTTALGALAIDGGGLEIRDRRRDPARRLADDAPASPGGRPSRATCRSARTQLDNQCSWRPTPPAPSVRFGAVMRATSGPASRNILPP